MWFFKNRGMDKIDKRIKQMELSLRGSFSKIKEDINLMGGLIALSTKKECEIAKRLFELESKLSALESNAVTDINPKKLEEKTKLVIEERQQLWDDLTDTQKLILGRLGLTQIMSKQPEIRTKLLIKEVYPDRDYGSIRSTVSSYLILLEELGLVQRKRRGKQTFVSLTEKGMEYFDHIKKKKLIKLVNRSKKKTK